MYLQNIHEFGKLLDWQDKNRMVERRRDEVPEVEGQYFPGQYAWVAGAIYAVRSSGSGPVLIAGDREFELARGRTRVDVDRTEALVKVTVYINDAIALEVEYKPDPILEFDPYEGKYEGIFEWLSNQLPADDFFERFTQAQ